MIKLLDFLLCGIITISELVIIFLVIMTIQLVMFKIFGINLFKILFNSLNRLDQYLNKVF